MLKFLKHTACALPLVLTAQSAMTQSAMAGEYGLGREALPEEVAAWDTDVRPDGHGLPDGSGSVEQGMEIFNEQCASCHGDFGEGAGRWPVLAGGEGTLDSDDPVKTIGSYWPYASTIFDYVQRSMPFGEARSLSNDETYAIVAYLLNLNYILEDDAVLSRQNFLDVSMPNEAGFFMDDRDLTEKARFAEPCMKDCKTGVEILNKARIIDVTPQGDVSAEDIVDDLSVGDPVLN